MPVLVARSYAPYGASELKQHEHPELAEEIHSYAPYGTSILKLQGLLQQRFPHGYAPYGASILKPVLRTVTFLNKGYAPYGASVLKRNKADVHKVAPHTGRVNGTREKGGFLPSFFRSVVFGKVYFTVQMIRFSRNRLFRRFG